MVKNSRNPDPPPGVMEVYRRARGYQLSQIMLSAAELEIENLLLDGARTIDELALLTGTVSSYLLLMMRVLVANGLFTESEDGKFANSEASSYLSSTLVMNREGYHAWGSLLTSLKTGEPAFPQVFGKGFFEYLAQNPKADEAWNRWNSESAREWLPQLAALDDFSGARTIVDVGGGEGVFLTEILNRNPDARGVLYDLANVVGKAGAIVSHAGVAGRCRIVPGSFLESVPTGGDTYCISRVLFNWDDKHVLRILRNCRHAMKGHERLVIVETFLPLTADPSYARLALNSLNLWMMFGSRHRTEQEYRRLLGESGLKALDTVSVPSSTWAAMRAVPV